jgi:putative hydrolase of the HAD superfamily
VGYRPAILIDIGGVLLPDHLHAAATAWGDRLGIGPDAFLAAVFGGSDDGVLVGRVAEPDWWRVVAGRLGADGELIGAIRRDLDERRVWDAQLLAGLRGLHGRVTVAVVSNAWPGMRDGMAAAGLLELADVVVLSCEAGFAKPDPRIYTTALRRSRVRAADALFIDDTVGHVDAARSLGMSGHVHTDTGETLALIQGWARRRG